MVAKAEEKIILSGNNFNLNVETNDKLAFQHPSIPWQTTGATVTLITTSGTLNGTNGTLTMYISNGKLTFVALENGTITLTSTSNATIFYINGKISNFETIINGKDYTIEWSFTEPYFLLPLMFIFGMTGLISVFIGPVYAIYKIKRGEYYYGLIAGFCMVVIGCSFVIAWLWGV